MSPSGKPECVGYGLSSKVMPQLTRPVMIAETISLGILALPKALSTLGLIPYPLLQRHSPFSRTGLLTLFPRGVITILAAGIISTYTGYTIGTLKRHYMQIHSMADTGDLLFGRFGRQFWALPSLSFTFSSWAAMC
jgi:hypothetical protein